MKKALPKGTHQLNLEKTNPIGPFIMKRKIIKRSKHSTLEVGEIIKVKSWGTFGCYDSKNRWVDMYCSIAHYDFWDFLFLKIPDYKKRRSALLFITCLFVIIILLAIFIIL